MTTPQAGQRITRDQLDRLTIAYESHLRRGEVSRGVYIGSQDDCAYYLDREGVWQVGAMDAWCWWDDMRDARAFVAELRRAMEPTT